MTHRVILSKGVHTSRNAVYNGNEEISISDLEYNDFKNAGAIVQDLGVAVNSEELKKENELLKEKIALLEKKLGKEEKEIDELPTNYMQLKKLAVDKGYKGEDMKADTLKEFLNSL